MVSPKADIIINETDNIRTYAVYFKKWEGFNLKFLGCAAAQAASSAIQTVANETGYSIKWWVNPPVLLERLSASVDGGNLIGLLLREDESDFNRVSKQWITDYQAGKIKKPKKARKEFGDIEVNREAEDSSYLLDNEKELIRCVEQVFISRRADNLGFNDIIRSILADYKISDDKLRKVFMQVFFRKEGLAGDDGLISYKDIKGMNNLVYIADQDISALL